MTSWPAVRYVSKLMLVGGLATMAMSVAPFTAAHLDAAAQLYVGVFNAAPWHDRWTPATARRRLADTLATPGALGCVLLADDLLGFALGYRESWFDGTHFSLKELCVRADRQRGGLGTQLLHQLERVLREQHVSRVYLLTLHEGPAQAFYARQGYYVSPKMRLMAHRLGG